MKLSRLTFILILMAALAAGFFIGTLTAHFHFRHFPLHGFRPGMHGPGPHGPEDQVRQEHMRERVMKELSGQLRLTPDQKEKLEVVFAGHSRDIQGAETLFDQTLQNIMQQTNQQILLFLNPEQKTKFEAWTQKRRPRTRSLSH